VIYSTADTTLIPFIGFALWQLGRYCQDIDIPVEKISSEVIQLLYNGKRSDVTQAELLK